MKKQRKFTAFVLIGILMGTFMFTGCSSPDMGETVATVNKAKVGIDEMMYYIYQTEQEGNYYEEFYQSYFGSSYWDMEYDEDRTFRDVAKEDTLNSAVMYTIFEERAKDAGYVLSEEEKEEIAADAQTFYDSLSDTQKETMNLDVEKIARIQEKIALGSKYYDEIMDGISIDEEEISHTIDPDEYRQYDVAYIYISTVDYDEDYNLVEYGEEEKQKAYETILGLLPKAMEAEDFDQLIPEDDMALEAGEIGFLKGDELFGAIFEEEALKLQNGQVADHIIEEEDGYYIVKMVNDNSTEAYDAELAEAVENAEYDEFQKVYDKLKEDYAIEINDSIWDGIVIGEITYEPPEESEEES